MFRPTDFTPKDRRQLAIEAGHRCVNEECGILTTAFDSITNRLVCLGVAAHDVAASPKGPRANPDMSVEKKRSISNGAWLCRNCAEMVDRLPERFPVGTISAWQRVAANDLLYRVTGIPKEPGNDE